MVGGKKPLPDAKRYVGLVISSKPGAGCMPIFANTNRRAQEHCLDGSGFPLTCEIYSKIK